MYQYFTIVKLKNNPCPQCDNQESFDCLIEKNLYKNTVLSFRKLVYILNSSIFKWLDNLHEVLQVKKSLNIKQIH